MLYKIFTLNTKIKTTIITICALSYNLTAQASPSYRPRDRVNKTMIELQTNGVERQLLDNSCGISSGVFKSNIRQAVYLTDSLFIITERIYIILNGRDNMKTVPV